MSGAVTGLAAPASPAQRLWRARPRLPPGWKHVLRTLTAFSLALYTAYALELESPSSAGLTVLIIAASSRGAILSKSIYRLLGSAVGGVVAILLVSLFAQAPWLFIAAFSLWLGLCTFLASLLRYFRSYGAVLAGYTIAIVGIPALANPDNVLILACGRVAVVSIGVLSTAFVFLVTDMGRDRSELIGSVGRLTAATARFIRDILAGAVSAETLAQGIQVVRAVEALDQTVEFSALEDTGIGRHAPDIRLAGAALLALLVSGRRTAALLQRPELSARADVTAASERVEDLVGRIATLLPDRDKVEPLRDDIRVARADLRGLAEACRDIDALAALLRAEALLRQFAAALATLVALHDDVPRAQSLRLKAYVNPVTALRNGTRAALAVFLGGAFWIVSGWSSGGAMLALLGPICALMGTLDSAAAASIGFFKGMLVATAVGLAVTYGVLPLMTGFPLLLLTMLPVIAAGLLVMQRPGMIGPATSFVMFFVVTVSPTNPMNYNLAGGLDGAVAYLLGGACSVLSFFVLLPANPPAEARVLQRSLRRSVRDLSRGRLPGWLRWEHLQYQKLVRLSQRLAAIAPARSAAALVDGGDVILLGRTMIRVRRLLDGPALPAEARPVVQQAISAFRQVIVAPHAAAGAARAAAHRLAGPADASYATLEAAALLNEMAALTDSHADFLARGEFWAASRPEAA
ncbi:Uncharacterized membrane protein YccC [Roseomonas rosea]|uniref:Uncharacterized membrane protein YccC n=1 Tax=Muricoccus roseus TaxID=198092 RepID=A0A1M6PUM1_9PROT|nr:FUSC family protein [Roseomonas rosea]SHK11606.1 Uncharacterized membrane protein YccC [Roseomonas rosea]